MEKFKLTLIIIFTALCWLSLCLDWDLMMYLSGIIALIIIWVSDAKKKGNDRKNSMEEK